MMGSPSAHRAACAPVSEQYMSSFVFLSLLLGWVVAWANPHLPICGIHLALKVITFKIIVHCNLYDSSFLLATFLLFFFLFYLSLFLLCFAYKFARRITL